MAIPISKPYLVSPFRFRIQKGDLLKLSIKLATGDRGLSTVLAVASGDTQHMTAPLRSF